MSEPMIGVAVVGCGYWGEKYARVFAATDRSRIVALCDPHAEKLAHLCGRHPKAIVSGEAQLAIEAPGVDAVAVATGASSHFDIAMAAIAAGKSVLVAKPVALCAAQVQRLIEAAAGRGVTLMADHTHVFDEAIRAIAELTARPEFGALQSYEATRASWGRFRADVDVLWDLAIHDLAILDHLLGCKPIAVSATGWGATASLAHLSLSYADGSAAYIGVSWRAPIRLRRTLIGGARQSLLYEESAEPARLQLFDLPPAGPDSPWPPAQQAPARAVTLPQREALASLADHFLDCVETSSSPLTDGASALRITEVLEAATRSLDAGGAPIEVA
jgi:predicted dehydrogenase